MTKQEYEAYEAAVAKFFEDEGINCLSDTPNASEDGVHEYCNEPYFSWQRCSVCGRLEGGDRVDMSGYNPTTYETQDGYQVCSDCQYYVAYGRLDDTTMLEIGE